MASLSTEIYSQLLAEQAAARHRTPKATVTHPAGVIVPDDFLLTENIKDPDYVPYCGPCMPMQRMRRNETGFYCPTCHNKTNWDLTKFNHNVDVQFDPERVDQEWLAKFKEEAAAIKNHEALHKETYATFKASQDRQAARNWDDVGKKNTGTNACGKCEQLFFGKRKRKYCQLCQTDIDRHLKQVHAENSWGSDRPKMNR